VGDPTAPVLRLFTWGGQVGALGIIVLLATASVAVIAFFVRRGAARAQVVVIVCSGLAAAALLTIIVITVRDFDVLLGSDPDSPLAWILPGIVGVTVLVGVAYGLFLRFAHREVHARIGMGNEVYQIEKARSAGSGVAESGAEAGSVS
jgi:cytochrome c biogenesis factor